MKTIANCLGAVLLCTIFSSCNDNNPSKGIHSIEPTGHKTSSPPAEPPCSCDTSEVSKIIHSESFKFSNGYSKGNVISNDKFWTTDSMKLKNLWFKEIEMPLETPYTKYWDAYSPRSVFADHLEFIDHYTKSGNVDFAIMIGPDGNLWAFRTYIGKKIGCCYLLTFAYYRHARFTEKSYTIINQEQADSLYSLTQQAITFKTKGYSYDISLLGQRHTYLKGYLSVDSDTTLLEVKATKRYSSYISGFNWINSY